MMSRLRTMLRHDEGASAVEYAIIVSLVAAVIVAVVFLLGSRTKSLYSTSNTCIGSQGTTC
jgi:pilus assembly protein Flp/PilA